MELDAQTPIPAPAAVVAPPPADPPDAAPGPPEAAEEAAALKAAEKADRKAERARRLRRWRRRWAAPAWVVSVLMHVGLLSALALATLTPEAREVLKDLDTALVDTKLDAGGEAEMTPILAEPVPGLAREEAAGSDVASFTQGIGTGSGPPSATPRIGVGGAVGAVSERSGLPGLKLALNPSGLGSLPALPTRDLGGGGRIRGDVTFDVKEVGTALDQIAREILRHLEDHKLTVVWLFDESGSMKDDQQAVKEHFGRVASDLRLREDASKKAAHALTHVVVGFGQGVHYEQEQPTEDIDRIGRAIDHLGVDETGEENVLTALREVIGHYGRLITKERRLLVVLNTDESGDDGGFIEEARQLAMSKQVPVYVVGRQALFGYSAVRIPYTDPLTKDVYYPVIRRGPESADVEALQYDGLHGRWDEQPSGFAPYELARLAKDTGGIYFLLPSTEVQRLKQREAAYSMATMKEYVPDYESRLQYAARRQESPLRRTLHQIIQETEKFGFRLRFPIDPAAMTEAAAPEFVKATEQLNRLIQYEQVLRKLEPARDREPERRWQAHYDLMLAQVVAYQITAYEYRACLEEMIRTRPSPSKMPSAQLLVEWDLHHSRDRKAPKEKTETPYREAERLMKLVIARHPDTPWADLARDQLKRGFGVQRGEWRHTPQYQERAKYVPKF